MEFVIFSFKDKPFDKIVVRSCDVFKVYAICDTVTIFLKNGEQIEVAETLSEVIEALNQSKTEKNSSHN